MNAFRRLEIEVDGIRETIRNYTSDPYINNILNFLKEAVEKKDIEEILYLMNQIHEWYKQNLQKINTNSFVYNKEVHAQILENIETYMKELPALKGELISATNAKNRSMPKKQLFISHSSKDDAICTAFVELLESIGIPEEMILYSSSPRHGIPSDLDIFDYLREQLSQGIIVFYMLSDNYYKSAYCLNEMGAAWIVQNEFSTFILPNFRGSIGGVIDKDKKAYTLNQPMDLIQLKNKLLERFELQISEMKWEEAKNKFLKVIKGL